MSKFKIEHGASRVNLVLLKTNIEDTISQDIDLLATWSDNDRKYLVNELLRFALTQEEDFQKLQSQPYCKCSAACWQFKGDTGAAKVGGGVRVEIRATTQQHYSPRLNEAFFL